jgi:alpha-beta hydrolase superfamily lysophospholipase
MSFLDNPLINQSLFYPSPAKPDLRGGDTHKDGYISIAETGLRLGYRFFPRPGGAATVLLFHGNGETAPDYDYAAWLFGGQGVALLVVDYRGYGWSDGQPSLRHLLEDVTSIHAAISEITPPGPKFIMGRSLGSAPALHLAHLYPGDYRGLIIESGFAHLLHLLVRRGFAPEILADGLDPLGNLEKAKALQLPLLVIHGAEDSLIPLSHGQELYTACPHEQKTLLVIQRAGHNNLSYVGQEQYYGAIGDFIRRYSEPLPQEPAEDVEGPE